ncbi:MAG TPA: hypothetical protein VLH77_02760, partial [Gammaproteobacteria bacterium]|nr:hypothetical protein [Gammaproteobacteria bacterium]
MRANQNPAEIQEWGEDLALEITTIAALAWFLKSAVDILEKHIPESKLPPILSQSSLQMLHKGLKDAKLQIIEDQRILGDGLASKADKEEALENLEVTPQIMYSALFDKKGVEARLEAFIVVLDELRGPATLS